MSPQMMARRVTAAAGAFWRRGAACYDRNRARSPRRHGGR
ncbi:hypothetical protein SXCC_04484 [Gluconacetobacter sp. SXCC-1]|nr:hypothetical protein SXCC_04484 [Gluconacetobacter sp. SXCC-1]